MRLFGCIMSPRFFGVRTYRIGAVMIWLVGKPLFIRLRQDSHGTVLETTPAIPQHRCRSTFSVPQVENFLTSIFNTRGVQGKVCKFHVHDMFLSGLRGPHSQWRVQAVRFLTPVEK